MLSRLARHWLPVEVRRKHQSRSNNVISGSMTRYQAFDEGSGQSRAKLVKARSLYFDNNGGSKGRSKGADPRSKTREDPVVPQSQEMRGYSSLTRLYFVTWREGGR
jgi:hypothetical protein